MVRTVLRNRRVNVAETNGDRMEKVELTEEQKKQVTKLRRSSAFKGAGMAAKFGMLLFLSNLVVLTIDGLYVHNKNFIFLGVILNFFLNFRSYNLAIQKEHDRIKLELQKILKNS